MQFRILLLTLLTTAQVWAQKKASDFEGEFLHRHSLYMTSENETVHGVEDRVRIQPVNDKEAQILIETYTHNFHSCQLVGKAQVDGDSLVYKSTVSKELNRGKKGQCVLKISLVNSENAQKAVAVQDQDDLCKLKFCGMRAQLGGEFREKSVEVKEKN